MINSGTAIEMWSNHSSINDNIITNNVGNGIYLYKSHNTLIFKNNINNNGAGIYLAGSKNNILLENEIKNHNHDGICLHYSNRNNISRNVVSKSAFNICFHFYSSRNIIRKNIISDSWQRGILIMYGSDNNTIYGNNFTNNKWYGLQLETNGNKVCYNNFIKNKFHAAFVRYTFITTPINYNKWDSNYWDNWIGLERPILSIFPKTIIGVLTRTLSMIPCFDFDRHPASEPYDITTAQGCGID